MGRSGGEAERGGHYRCEPRDKGESFRNRIMASCLNALSGYSSFERRRVYRENRAEGECENKHNKESLCCLLG